MKTSTAALLAVIVAGLPLQAAFADSIGVPKEEFGAVDEAQMESLTEQLREIGVIGDNDKLESTGEAAAGDERGLDPITLATYFGPLVCKYIVGEQRAKKLAACAKKKTEEAKTQCQTNVQSWSDPIAALCDLIKLN